MSLFQFSLFASYSPQLKLFDGNHSLKMDCISSWKKYAVDQVLLPTVLVIDKIWQEDRNATVCVSQIGDGIENKFCLIQIIFIMDGQQPIIAVIFIKKGKLIKSQ